MADMPRLPDPPPPWHPTHRLRWVPRAGVAVEWLVHVETHQRDGRTIMMARSLEEAQGRSPASWVFDGGEWRWNGRRGFLGAEGVAKLLPLPRR